MSVDAGPAWEELRAARRLEMEGRLTEAESCYGRVIEQWPSLAVARFNFACFLRRRGRLDEALGQHRTAIDLGIDRPEEVLTNMAVIEAALHRHDASETLLQRALAINPAYIAALFNLALQREEFGDRAAALELFGRILDIDPNYHDALVRIVYARTIEHADDPVIRRLRRALRRSNLAPLTRESLHFALGKALDDCGRYGEAFAQYQLGNRLSAARVRPYERQLESERTRRIVELFTADWLAGAAAVSQRPLVFVTGMFRSGSTLFEQVLAAHPRIIAGGEIEYLNRQLLAPGTQFPDRFATIAPQEWRAIGDGYVEYLDRTFPAGRIVTNKRPDAFALFGILLAMFPNARFVHTVRDPRDTCLSIWFQQFDSQLAYANDLAAIAHHAGECRRLMDHWRALAGHRIFDANYDEYVRDPRAVTGRLLQYLGLEWHDDCLHFQRSPARVRTASVSQVREPLYRKSSGRWRNYAEQLAGVPGFPSAG